MSHQDWKVVTIRNQAAVAAVAAVAASKQAKQHRAFGSTGSNGFVLVDENNNEKIIRKHNVSKDEARKIVIARNKLGMTQQELADKVNISKDTMSKIENPQNLTRNAQTMSKIYKVLNL